MMRGTGVVNVYDVLLRMIITGKLPMGEKVVQLKLAKQIGASQATVREQLQRLEARGLVESKENHGWTVSMLTVQVVVDHFQIMQALAGLAARLIVQAKNRERVFEADLLALEQSARSFSKAENLEPPGANEFAWHKSLVALSKNRFLGEMLERSWLLERIFYLSAPRPGLFHTMKMHRAPVLKEHLAIVAAIREGSELGAEEACRLHAANNIQRFKERTVEESDFPQWTHCAPEILF